MIQYIKRILRDIVLTEEELSKLNSYDELNKLNYEYINRVDELEDSLDFFTAQLTQVNKSYVSLQEKYSELLNAGYVDVNNLKDWYEGRRNQTPWIYNGARLGHVDVKKYLVVQGEDNVLIMKESASTIINKYKILKDTPIEKIVEYLLKYFSSSSQWHYVYDKDKFGMIEFWQSAEKSWIDRKGDCDDLAILIHVLFNYIMEYFNRENESWRLTFAAGLMNVGGGHAFNTFLHTDGEYYVVESTFDINGSYSRTWLHTPVRYDNTYYSFWGFATKDKSWKGDLNALINYNDINGS